MVAMFLLSVLGMIWSGHATYNDELREHGSRTIGLAEYLVSWRLPLGTLRKLGERILADVGLCNADSHAVSARFGRVS
ncbi:hypothetical protein MESS2_1620002 [Mesorhizobium metallidurans STM 2683]|uniref:Uncharacterized protein n=1 Tax=Mesorhizobium metallidurans STM 2683 TaxID=1297569 RepID=M5EMQ8_9HYPH|nr:hypothetical protein MESS2_1620002 [Mesorhizobium metallidurans STM 2683]